MSMTVVVTRNVSDRVRGFLASSMLELAPGVYSAPKQSPAVRDRIWAVLTEWFRYEEEASVIQIWQDSQVPGGQSVRVLGLPPIDLVMLDGIVLSRRPGKSIS
ncbi:CRISPR-associated protein Cas2 [Methylomarinovum caldicuralii]|uniref:CRISPR-associated protein Cas2 n=1 Tax=Methylomarinovum caldicuralii TaxID=438856 RepID=A0AAU9CHY0_9GAMM|nr:type I-E CRISPR-associated endoribonuclease Cas2e [Methylomarinovum caldicuralii]BCX82595.1 CRISPR-associated protein Cas2 [Methylomarinovum caldicuralii]